MKHRELSVSINLRPSVLGVLVLVAVVMFGGVTLAAAQTEFVIHSFQHVNYGGTHPTGGVAADLGGALYGTTLYGGATPETNFGLVYRLSPPSTVGAAWKETVLYSFTGSADGENPSGVLVDAKSRKIYGTAENWAGGGSGFGLVYELTPGSPWTRTVIYTFAGPDGKNPNKGLIADDNGALYGTTTQGGNPACGGINEGCGVVYELTPPAERGGAWTEQVLYSFTGGDDGYDPAPGVIFDRTGTLYGMTESGGSASAGTVFKLTPPSGGGGAWTENTIHTFNGSSGSSEGAYPTDAPTVDPTGALYGTTSGYGQYGYGNIFKLTPPAKEGQSWTETILYNFTGASDGGYPLAGLIFDSAGALYGTTIGGGDVSGKSLCSYGGYGCGTVFKLSPPSAPGSSWTETVLYAFPNFEGYPEDPVLLLGNNLYGVTPQNNSDAMKASGKLISVVPGTVFQITQ